MNFRQNLQQKAFELGFNAIGLTPAAPSPYLEAYLRWVEAGMHGAMGYLARPDRLERRKDLNVILPGVKSLVMVGLDYATSAVPPHILNDPLRGRISNYAWNVDYHNVMEPRLEALAAWLREETRQPGLVHRVYVDHGPIMERSHAMQAGMGFTGKNTLLIHPRRGSFFFLGELLTTYEFEEYDTPHEPNQCGNCTRCLNACPTSAFPRPFVLDARRCISYLTIELKTSIPVDLRPMIGNWIYGCDVCQEVCPYVRRFTEATPDPAFYPVNVDAAAPPLPDLLSMTPADFEARYQHSPIKRIGYERLLRNACVAAGNAAAAELRPLLENIASRDALPLAVEHARWALEQGAS